MRISDWSSDVCSSDLSGKTGRAKDMATVSRSSETVCDANLWFGCVKRRPKTAAERSPGRAPVRSPPRSPPSNRSASRGATAFPSMVAVRADLAAEHPIGPDGIGQDNRQDEDDADENADLALQIGRAHD